MLEQLFESPHAGRGHGAATVYTLDRLGNVTGEATTGQTPIVRAYQGTRLTQVTQGPDVKKHFYDAEGNLDCVTTGAWAGSACPEAPWGAAADPALLQDAEHDPYDRLWSHRAFQNGAATDTATYVHDALDRVAEQVEAHPGQEPRRAFLAYLGLTKALTTEHHQHRDTMRPLVTRAYDLDATGRRLRLHEKPYDAAGSPQPVNRYYYGYDPRGSVSLLLNEAGGAKASYGYTPYGKVDAGLTSGDSELASLVNPFRFQGKRFETGSASYDMGARRFGPQQGRFWQRDAYEDALGDLGLGLDPLTGNRYALAGGNPVSFVERDGHEADPIGEQWRADFRAEHDGREPSEQDIFDRLLSLQNPQAGSQPGGGWSLADWVNTYQARQQLWQVANAGSGGGDNGGDGAVAGGIAVPIPGGGLTIDLDWMCAQYGFSGMCAAAGVIRSPQRYSPCVAARSPATTRFEGELGSVGALVHGPEADVGDCHVNAVAGVENVHVYYHESGNYITDAFGPRGNFWSLGTTALEAAHNLSSTLSGIVYGLTGYSATDAYEWFMQEVTPMSMTKGPAGALVNRLEQLAKMQPRRTGF